jgi:ketosteroid isomerase-like protein
MPTTFAERRAQVHAVTEALNARDFDALAHLPWHPEMVFHSLLTDVEGTAYRGVEMLRRWAADVDAVWDGYRIEVLDVRAASDDRVVVIYRIRATARASGLPLDIRTGQVWTWRDDMLWRNHAYGDPRAALAAAGLDG